MKPEFIVWHESASPFGTADTIREWHQARGWKTIGYHGVILNGYLTSSDFAKRRKVAWLDGAFQVGRTWDGDGFIEGEEVGAHVYGLNSESLGLCMIGANGQFSESQMLTAFDVTLRWAHQFDVQIDNVIGHYEIGRVRPKFATSKTCPGLPMEKVRESLKIITP